MRRLQCQGAHAHRRASLPVAQDAEANERLDAVLEAFLRLLSAYFLLPAATRALEYLVRRYKCVRRARRARAVPRLRRLTSFATRARRLHEYNVDAAVTCALPYHATVQFVRLVQVLRVEGTCWTFLTAVKSEGAPPTRDALVACFARSSTLLAVLADVATSAATGSARGARGVANSFYTLLLTEAVASMARLPEDRVYFARGAAARVPQSRQNAPTWRQRV